MTDTYHLFLHDAEHRIRAQRDVHAIDRPPRARRRLGNLVRRLARAPADVPDDVARPTTDPAPAVSTP